MNKIQKPEDHPTSFKRVVLRLQNWNSPDDFKQKSLSDIHVLYVELLAKIKTNNKNV